MMKLLGVLILLPSLAHAYTASDLKMVLDDKAVIQSLGDSHIHEITGAPCNRMRGSFCLDIKVDGGKTINIQGNNFFKSVDVTESSEDSL